MDISIFHCLFYCHCARHGYACGNFTFQNEAKKKAGDFEWTHSWPVTVMRQEGQTWTGSQNNFLSICLAHSIFVERASGVAWFIWRFCTVKHVIRTDEHNISPKFIWRIVGKQKPHNLHKHTH